MNSKKFLTLLIIVLLFTSNCSKKKKFNFNRDWTYQELSAFTENPETQKQIEYMVEKLPLEDAYFVFREIAKFKKPSDMDQFAELEKLQKEKGGQFTRIVPPVFIDKQDIPTPDNFDNTIKTAFYFAKVRELAEKNLFYSGIFYNIKFRDEKINQVERKSHNLDITFNLSIIKKLLNIYDQGKINEQEIQNIAKDKIFQNMLQCSADNYKAVSPPTTGTLAYFIKTATTPSPVHRLWNWIVPINNFGFAELYADRKNYSALIKEIEDKHQLFEDRILAKAEKYIPEDYNFKSIVDFGVNFGQRSWSNDESAGINIIYFKDDLKSFSMTTRNEIFRQILKELNTQTNTVTPDFGNEKDEEYYDVLSFIYTEGLAKYIGGIHPNFDYTALTKESSTTLEQIQTHIYNGKKPEILAANKRFTMEKNGLYTGLGYTMARTIERRSGRDKLKQCIQNGPVYFFKSYIDLQQQKQTKKYARFEDKIIKKINEFYNLQAKNYIE